MGDKKSLFQRFCGAPLMDAVKNTLDPGFAAARARGSQVSLNGFKLFFGRGMIGSV
jgi:hypothetical protein